MLSFLFPSNCLVCNGLGAYICLKCQKKLKYISKDVCVVCGNPSLFGFTHTRCKKRYALDGVISILHYSTELKKIIAGIKYQLITEAWHDLLWGLDWKKVSRLASFFHMFSTGVFFQPIPLHASRHRERGFNQAEVLTCYFQQFSPFPSIHLLSRVIDTPHQSQITENEKRKRNIIHAFRYKETKYKPKTIILIDDVVTSGSTIEEAAQELKKHGLERVYALSLAQG